MRRLSVIPLLTLIFGLSACIDRPDLPTGPTPIEKEEFAPELGVDLSEMTKTETGLYYQDLTVGEGKAAKSGSRVEVHYTGWLVNGFRFDSSLDRGQTFFVTIDSTNVIAGWQEGLKGMRVGGIRKLVIPSQLAYGAMGNPPIPPYATVIFDVKVVSMRDDDESDDDESEG